VSGYWGADVHRRSEVTSSTLPVCDAKLWQASELMDAPVATFGGHVQGRCKTLDAPAHPQLLCAQSCACRGCGCRLWVSELWWLQRDGYIRSTCLWCIGAVGLANRMNCLDSAEKRRLLPHETCTPYALFLARFWQGHTDTEHVPSRCTLACIPMHTNLMCE
jgi:hypothetical protein